MSVSNSSKSATIRTRNFAAIVYPDSAPQDWENILTAYHVPAFISPLHDKDINPDGSQKKPHYHVLLCFENVKTQEQANEIFYDIGAVGNEFIQSLRGYARYLCHLDNPEKYQYNTALVRSFGGADYFSVIDLPTDRYKTIREIKNWCLSNHCVSFAELFDYAAENRSDWFRVLCDNSAYVIDKYLKSKTWTIDYYKNHTVVHEDTGEIVEIPKGFEPLNDDNIIF